MIRSTRRAIAADAALLSIIGASAMLAGSALAGPLNPPAGPVSSTNKTLDQVEPRTPLTQETAPGDSDSVFRITSPGSYYLTSQVSVPGGFAGIEIATSNVTIDLSGYRVVAQAGAVNGIEIESFFDRATVRNGRVIGFDNAGIDLRTVNSTANNGCTIERVEATSCDVAAFELGTDAVVRDCHVSLGSGSGIVAGSYLTVTDTVIYSTQSPGIQAGEHCLIERCSISNIVDTGVVLADNCSIIECTINDCSGFGIVAGDRLSVVSSQVNDNGSFGIDAGDDAAITACSVNGNGGEGIQVQAGAVIRGCVVNNNSGFGILVNGDGGLVEQCTAAFNSTGIFIGSRGTVRHCAATGNGLGINGASLNLIEHNNTAQCSTGITVIDQCTVRNNHHTGGTLGIEVFGNGNSVDSNTVVNTTAGFDVPGSGNILTRNRVRGASVPYGISAGNDAGTIQSSPAGAGAWDNFTY